MEQSSDASTQGEKPQAERLEMMESQSTAQGEEPQLCSISSLQKLCDKNPRILLISTKEDRRNFIQKFADGAAPKNLALVELQASGPCEIVEKLGMKDAGTAILVEKGEVRSRITLTNDDVKDTVALIRMLSECEPCKAELVIDKKSWMLKPEPTKQCETALSNVSELRPEVRKYLEKHIASEGHQ